MKKFAKYITNLIIIIFIIPVLLLLKFLPLCVGKFVFKNFVYHIVKQKYLKIISQNLKIAFPKKNEIEIQKLAKENLINALYNFAEINSLGTLFYKFWGVRDLKNTTIVGREVLDSIKEDERPVVFVTAHMGGYEAMVYLLCFYDFGKKILYHTYRHSNNKLLDYYIVNLSRNVFSPYKIKKESGGKSAINILKILKKNNIVQMNVDQKSWEGVLAPFFGKQCYTTNFLTSLNKRIDVRFIPVFAIRDKNSKSGFKIHVFKDMELTGDAKKDAIMINKMVEGWVKMYPDQFFTFLHKRWKL